MLGFAQTVNLDVILVSAVPLEFSPTMFILLWPNIDTSCIFCQMLKFSGVGGVEHGQDSQRYKGVSSRTYYKHLLIPHICHGSHGYSRVNFFWPV